MKKVLPRTATNTRGFSLIELMIAISIVAVLSVTGFLALTQAQRTGRDARRRAELDAIALALEAKKDPNSYYYSGILDTDFPTKNNKIPSDTSTQQYCMWVWGTPLPSGGLSDVPNWKDTPCPASKPSIGATAGTLINVNSGVIAETIFTLAGTNWTNATAWVICANLEAGGKAYCVKSAQ